MKITYCFFLCSILLVAGCKDSLIDRSLIFATRTTIGVEVSASPAETGTPAEIVIGYKRFEGVLNPVYCSDGTEIVASPDGGTTIPRYRPEAYSVIAKLQGQLKGTAGSPGAAVYGAQWFATGEAATKMAEHPAFAAVMTNDPNVAAAAVKIADRQLELEDTWADSASLRDQLDQLRKKDLKDGFTEDGQSFESTNEYVRYAAHKINPKKSWVRIRAEAGEELEILIECVENAVQD